MTHLAFWSYFKDSDANWVARGSSTFSNPGLKVADVLKLSLENRPEDWQAWSSEETLGSLASRLSCVHRILVALDDKAKLLTQTDLVKFIAEHDQENVIMKEPISAMATKYSWRLKEEIVKLNSDRPAIEGFRIMYMNKVTAVPVIDSNQRLVTTLSSSDARIITEENLSTITLPVIEFLNRGYGALRQPVTARMNCSVGEVINKLLASKIHRVWLEEDDKVVGVVSMSDILQLWASEKAD
eukprot:TRINITY_DN1785_c0_g1_i4.p1 TRINITY_DN1785_c0_g1~~TRINITY_DN1785_c0_g1_i4.p1  ORF type:complete len:241 (-),score=21.47 TRINITY_DN1785_c0_g1_i4:48-770(-)